MISLRLSLRVGVWSVYNSIAHRERYRELGHVDAAVLALGRFHAVRVRLHQPLLLDQARVALDYG